MIKPGINALSSCADSRYTLVTMAAKRARMIGEDGEGLVPCDVKKPVSMAVAEIASGKVGYIRHEKKSTDENQMLDEFYLAANGDHIVDENVVVVEK
ncbi:MAG: DNA-directed RNA polymerase subunit omega [Clostridia bacterium]|nr:DNA-directed RNA polymerase subunit omega [Clostridia bacterium]